MSHTMTLDDYTDADRTDHEAAKLRLAHDLAGRGYDDRISSTDLAAGLPVSPSTVRDLIAELRRERGLAVYSFGSGYFEVQDADDLERAVGQIEEMIATKQQTKRELLTAFDGGDDV
jgi:DNA-binding GntR family transcriptional regulator